MHMCFIYNLYYIIFSKTTFVFLCAPQALNTKPFWKPAADWAPLRHTLVWARSPAGSREAGPQTPILRNAPSTVRSAMCGSTQNCSSNRWARVMVFIFHEMTLVYVLLYTCQNFHLRTVCMFGLFAAHIQSTAPGRCGGKAKPPPEPTQEAQGSWPCGKW